MASNIGFDDIPDERLSCKTPLEAAKCVELRILRIFDRICKANGLTWCMAWGTVLGAVRHKGFIPWDDDIDVHMPFEDYKKFVKIATSVLPDDIGFFQGMDTQCGFGKLVDKKSFYKDATVLPGNDKMPEGIFVDVFPLRSYRSRRLFEFLTPLSRHAILNSLPYGRISFLTLLKKWFWSAVRWCVIRPLDCMNHSLNGKWFGVPQYMWGTEDALPSNPFPAVNLEFEGCEFPAPRETDEYLRTTYGEYMKLPPKEKRYTHAKLIVPLVKPVDEAF